MRDPLLCCLHSSSLAHDVGGGSQQENAKDQVAGAVGFLVVSRAQKEAGWRVVALGCGLDEGAGTKCAGECAARGFTHDRRRDV